MKPLKPWKLIISCFLAGTSLLILTIILFFTPVSYDGGFNRIYQKKALTKKSVIDLKFNSYYFAGLTASKIYLGNFTAPSRVLSFPSSLLEQDSVRLSFPKNYRLARSRILVAIDSAHVYGWENVTPAMAYGSNVADKLAYHSFEPHHLFAKPVFLPSHSIITRGYDSAVMKCVLVKISTDSSIHPTTANVLEKQIDGYFCTDGFLVADVPKGQLVYVYYYRNQFIRMDTSMNLLRRGRTIDTVSTAHIKVSSIPSDNSHTLSSPPAIVNKRAFIHANRIFIQSAIKGGAEDSNIFKHSTVLDVYDLQTAQYLYSTAIPDHDDSKVIDFAVRGRTLLALQGNYLIAYEMNEP